MTKERSKHAQGSRLSGWGRHSAPGSELLTENLERGSADMPLSRGLGRSYGDSSLPPADKPFALNTTLADRILAFDEESGLLRAEAGLALAELNRLLLPRGWFTPVTPGTQYVTLGGMVAADVHGKNQHVDGDFGDHVTRLLMRVADERVLWCSPEEHADLFYGSIGGMGLLGHILEVEFTMRRVPSPWIWQETERVANIDAFERALSDAAKDWPMTVGWIDCVAGGANLGHYVVGCLADKVLVFQLARGTVQMAADLLQFGCQARALGVNINDPVQRKVEHPKRRQYSRHRRFGGKCRIHRDRFGTQGGGQRRDVGLQPVGVPGIIGPDEVIEPLARR